MELILGQYPYSAAFVSWTKSEPQAIDRKTRKLFTISGALHPKSDVDRLYIPRKEEEEVRYPLRIVLS